MFAFVPFTWVSTLPEVTSNVDAGYDGHVCNHARVVRHDVINVTVIVSIRDSSCPSPPCFLLKLLYVKDLAII